MLFLWLAQSDTIKNVRNESTKSDPSHQLAFVSFSAVKISVDTYANGSTGKIFSILSLKGSDLLRNTISTISPFVYFVLLMLFGIGFSLSVYLPMIPFIFWLSAAANWIVSVLVGSTGGSLWAATHIGTEEEKGSRSAYGYIFLIDAQIRPMLMVLGFLFASLVVVAIGTLLNMLFGPTIANVQANSITGIVSLVGLLMIYARICTTTVTRVFALQVTMPDYVISWLGGREAASSLGGMAESTKNIFAGFSHGLMRTPGANIKTVKTTTLTKMELRELFSLAKFMYVIFAVGLGFIFFCITIPVFGSHALKGDFLSPVSWGLVLITFMLFSSALFIYKRGMRKIEEKLRSINFTPSNELQLFNPVSGRYIGINLITQKIVLISLPSKKVVTELPLKALAGYELEGSTLKLKFNDYDTPSFPMSNNSGFRDKLDVYLNS